MDDLLTVELTSAAEDSVLALWRSVETSRRRHDPVEYRLIEESTLCGLPGTHGCSSPKPFVRQLLTIPGSHADAYAFDQDGRFTDAKKAHKRRGIRIVRRDDGSATLTGELTCELAELLQVILDAYAAPKPNPDGTPDPRTAA